MQSKKIIDYTTEFRHTKLLQLKSTVIINEVQSYKAHKSGVLTNMNPSPVSSYLLPPRPKYLPQHPILLQPSQLLFLSHWEWPTFKSI